MIAMKSCLHRKLRGGIDGRVLKEDIEDIGGPEPPKGNDIYEANLDFFYL